MKRIATLLSACAVALRLWAAVPASTPKTVTFKWQANPADLGGMSLSDYYTNITFIVYSVTNCTIPTNLWPVVTNWQASTFPSSDGVNWTNSITIDGSTRFYLISVANGNGGASPPSSVATWVPSPPVGFQPRVYGP